MKLVLVNVMFCHGNDGRFFCALLLLLSFIWVCCAWYYSFQALVCHAIIFFSHQSVNDRTLSFWWIIPRTKYLIFSWNLQELCFYQNIFITKRIRKKGKFGMLRKYLCATKIRFILYCISIHMKCIWYQIYICLSSVYLKLCVFVCYGLL